MTWRRWLQKETRNPAFLWRMVIAILLVGIGVGMAVDATVPAWIEPPAEETDGDEFSVDDPSDEAPPAPGPEPEPKPHSTDDPDFDELAERGQWLDLWKAIPAAIADDWTHVGAAVLAVLTGACWLAFTMQAIQPRNIRDGRLWLPPLAMMFGVLSVWPTLFFGYWMEVRWNLRYSELLAPAVRFFVLSVGLREELSKFVCYLPFLAWAVWKRDELAALMLAGCVGLGFGMEENINYIYGSVATATLTRLLLTVPLHMAMTGLIGLAAYRACLWPRDWGPQFIAWLGVIVLAHGIYDVFAGTPAVEGYGYFGLVIFVALVHQYFRHMRPKQALRVEPISLTANFLFCVATVAATTFVYLSAAIGWQTAGDILVASLVGQAVMVYLFLREMPEALIRV
jgi:RsiW-degrading membrane proteinase PrsW (M82 family)